MSDPLARDLALLIEAFKAQGWHELRVETGTISLLVSQNMATEQAAPEMPRPASTPIEPPAPSSAISVPSSAQRHADWIPITAPNLGTFYRSPKPGSAPFVVVGDTVESTTEVCLLEVMKLFTSVTAGVAGVVREIVAQDAELVEGGQPLFYIEPQGK